ncbi:hypothetical protein [Thiohalorhabdus sp.]|uniref:hypothetical protein n=1 Tax=Thiohalorhabdus sp. TaxID=3094134 RepID=UPI002FC2EE6D
MAGELYKTWKIIPGEPKECWEECTTGDCYTVTETYEELVVDGYVCTGGTTYESDAAFGGGGSTDGSCTPTGHYEEKTRTYEECTTECTTVCEGGSDAERDANLGWNASARSIDEIEDSGAVEFRISAASVGVVVGLNEGTYETTGYQDIHYAIYAERGEFRVLEEGAFKTGRQVFTNDDWFRIERERNTVHFYLNGSRIHTSDRISSDLLFLEAVFYMADDRVLEAKLTDANRGGGSGELEPLDGFGRADSRARASLYFQKLRGKGFESLTGQADNSFLPLRHFGGEGTYAEAQDIFLYPLTGDGSGGKVIRDQWGYADLALQPVTGGSNATEINRGRTFEVAEEVLPTGPGEADLSFQELTAFGGAGDYADAAGDLYPLMARGAGELLHRTLVLAPLEGLGANYPYTHADLTLEALENEATAGIHMPQPVIVDLTFQALDASGFSLTGSIGGGGGDMEPLVGLAAEGVYGEGNPRFEPLEGLAFEDLYPDSWGLVVAPVPDLTAQGHAAELNGVVTESPFIEAELRGGGSAMAMEPPAATADIQAEWSGVGRMVYRASLPDLTATGEAIGLGQADLRLGRLTALGEGGGTARGRLAPFQILGESLTGGIGTLDREAPAAELSGEGRAIPTGVAVLAFQALRGGGTAAGEPIEAPAAYLRATGEEAA